MISILFFYGLGLIAFILAIEEEKDNTPKNIIYLGLSFFINLMGYELSYTDTDYTSAAYFPLILLVITVLIMVWMAFTYLNKATSDHFEDNDED